MQSDKIQQLIKIKIKPLQLLINMSLSLSTDITTIIGLVFSATAIALGVLQCLMKKTHSRSLDYVQWGYFLAVVYGANLVPFSQKLYIGSSFITLNSDATTNFFCPMGTLVCRLPFALSFLVILVGFLVLMRLITISEKVREKGINFPRVYRMFKGLIKWFYLPLMYQSIYDLIKDGFAIPDIVVIAILIIFPIVQVILYKCFDDQKEDPMIKWLEFANYAKAGLFSLLVILAFKFGTTIYFYYLALILIAYACFFTIKYNFKYEVAGRVFYISGQVIFYFLFSLYAAGSEWLTNLYLDLFCIGIIILLDLIYLIMEIVIIYRQWKSNSGSQVIPEDSNAVAPKNKNRYEVEQISELHKNGSRDNLYDSRVEANNLTNSGIGKGKNTTSNNRPKPK